MSLDLETGCPKLAVSNNIFGHPTFHGRYQYTQIATINVYLLHEIKHDVHIQCHGKNTEVKKIQFYA